MANSSGTTRRCRNCARVTRDRTNQAYGVLNSIGGVNASGRYILVPESRSAIPPCDNTPCDFTPRDPIYRGPCPPNPDGTDLQYVYGYFRHVGALEARGTGAETAADDGALYRRIDMNDTVIASEEGILRGLTSIIITDPGIYSITYNLRVPADTVIDTTIALMQGASLVPGTAVEVVKSIGSVSMAVSASALIQVGEGAQEISLVSTSPLSIFPTTGTDAATITVFSVA